MTDPKQQSIEHELSVLEKIELAGKCAAVSLPLTYVSGYLITTSYLGTYGIHLGSSELFRAKYIYVGFQYLMFLAFIAIIFRLILQVVRVITGPADDTFASELALAKQAMEDRHTLASEKERDRFRTLRGDLFAGLILLVFIMEIMFLNPENLGDYLVPQAVYLVGVALYHLSWHRELREPYTWGLVHGVTYIEDLRWLLLNAQAMAVSSLLLNVVIKSQVVHGAILTIAVVLTWLLVAAAAGSEIITVLGICASRKRLAKLDRLAYFNPPVSPNPGAFPSEVWRNLKSLRSLRGSWEGYLVLCGKSKISHATGAAVACIPLFSCLWFLWLLEFTWNGVVPSHPRLLDFLLVWFAHFLTILLLFNVGYVIASLAARSQCLERPAQSERGAIVDTKWEHLGRRLVLATTLYIASVMSFAYVWYPHIPVQKAGGNYATAKSVCVRLVGETPEGQCSRRLLPVLRNNEAFIALEEDSEWVYLASDNDEHGGRPTDWSFPGYGTNYHRPTVYAVSRSCIAGLSDALSEASDQRCAVEASQSAEDAGGEKQDANGPKTSEGLRPVTDAVTRSQVPEK